jgi:cysteine-rich repeat protein
MGSTVTEHLRRMFVSFVSHKKMTLWPPAGAWGMWTRAGRRDGRPSALIHGLLWFLSGCLSPPTPLLNVCGDAVAGGSEECDDGAMSEGCDIDCTLPTCGDGLANPKAGELCDDGNTASGDGCSADCGFERCGNGVVDPGEDCDPGHAVAEDGCSLSCRADSTCGNGVIESGETCDDGNAKTGDGCSPSCRLDSVCGNDVIEPGEACDDGNVMNGDGCSTDCRLESCGNSVVDPGEACDHGGVPTRTCDGDCTAVECGDTVINPLAGEQCDDGGQSVRCDSDCTVAWCGDGTINVATGEQCDDAGLSSTCDHDCSARVCGDGVVNGAAGEQCDDSGQSARCDSDCSAAWCGDGTFNAAAGEECDDGNRVDGDGCNACMMQLDCGNGTLDPGEDVDPGPGLSLSVPVDTQTCRYDFSSISQLYCIDECGTWGGGDGCQQEDADVLCKLKMDNPDSTALSFTIGESSVAPGICCPPPFLDDPSLAGCVALGVFADRGVGIAVSVHDTDLLDSHGPGQVVTDVVCTDP